MVLREHLDLFIEAVPQLFSPGTLLGRRVDLVQDHQGVVYKKTPHSLLCKQFVLVFSYVSAVLLSV